MFARSSVNMATPCELSLSEIRRYLIDNGGSARNRDLVKYFKGFLTDPETRVDARNKFKEYVNELATIKNDEDEKYLVLKKKYRPSSGEIGIPFHSHHSTIQTSQESQNFPSSPSSPSRDPPPYRSPPPAPSPSTDSSPSSPHFSPPEQLYATVNKPKRMAVSTSVDHLHQQDIHDERNRKTISGVSDTSEIQISSPPVPPRRKSHDKLKLENKENINMRKEKSDNDVIKEHAVSTPDLPSVRERMQRFNRMASETDIHGRTNSVTAPTKKRSDKGADEDDTVSVASQLDGKAREWLVRAAQGDYQALAKLAAEEPRLTRLKDPSSGTALHWGAKHGDENIVKLIAGTYKDYIKSVNGTTNGGYTALHLAMQFDHENIFNLLVQVYGANQEIRDHSGKKARQYVASQEAAVSQDTFRKIKARKKHTEKDLGFLRIGSLNVRVKRTTEAFSQFLGVASSTSHNHEKIHKTWGSADNIQEHKMMLPPRYAPIKKRRSKRAQDFISSRGHVASQPSTPLPQTKDLVHKSTKPNIRRPSSITAITPITSVISHDSDSDGACGFDSAWRGSAQL